MPVAGLPLGLWSPHNDLQSLQSLVSPAHLATHTASPCRGRLDRGHGINRRNLCEGSPLRPWRKRGAKTQAIGLSRGGQTTKIHILTDVLGRPAVIRLTPGNVSDIRVADELIEAAGPVRRLIADRGYDANSLRRTLRSAGTIPVIPGRRSRKRPIRHDTRRYRDRWRIEAAFCRLKDFRRVATRYDKLAVNFLSAVVLAAIVAFWV